MESQFNRPDSVSKGAYIINKAQSVKLNPSVLYEAVVDLSSEGLLTANCINMAAGILLEDLGLPTYFFENIKKDSLKHILGSIATSTPPVRRGMAPQTGAYFLNMWLTTARPLLRLTR